MTEDRKKIFTIKGSLKRYDVPCDCSLPHFLELVDDIVQSIPAGQREDILVEWDDGGDCEYITFTHYRDETDEEMQSRLAANRDRVAEREASERNTYEALKRKYE